jgi:Protein of unknown function (DUF2911)
MRKTIALCTVFVLGFAALVLLGGARQQDKSKRPSPQEKAECMLPDGKSIATVYSSPRMKGRKIFAPDGLVPFGRVWRAGANEATTLVTTADLTADGKDIPDGSYTLFVVPNADKWALIINKKTGEWGVPYKYESDELARIDMQVAKLSAPVENFTIAYDQSGGGCTLNMEWETTRASVTFTEKK